jgi:hypothetical protein
MTVRDAIELHAHYAYGADSADVTETWAQVWSEAGFSGAEVDEWLKARCFQPAAARDLADAGVAPEDAREITHLGSEEYSDTIGYKVANGDLEVDEARQLAGIC